MSEPITKLKDLPFQEQCALVLIELLDRLVENKETKARVEHAVNELFGNLPWYISPDEVMAFADKVAEYGISQLPGYKEDGGG